MPTAARWLIGACDAFNTRRSAAPPAASVAVHKLALRAVHSHQFPALQAYQHYYPNVRPQGRPHAHGRQATLTPQHHQNTRNGRGAARRPPAAARRAPSACSMCRCLLPLCCAAPSVCCPPPRILWPSPLTCGCPRVGEIIDSQVSKSSLLCARIPALPFPHSPCCLVAFRIPTLPRPLTLFREGPALAVVPSRTLCTPLPEDVHICSR